MDIVNKILGKGKGKGDYKAHKFKTFGEAKTKQIHMKGLYGYEPEILMEKDTKGKSKFIVVEPKNLTRIK